MAHVRIVEPSAPDGDAVSIVTTPTGPDRYRIVATATFESAPAEVWELLSDWERLLGVGLPGMTSNFRWLHGSPAVVPSTFAFEVGDATLKEEIYERSTDQKAGRYLLRYRALEPALGVVEYDAVIELHRTAAANTAFRATRAVRLAPGTGPDMLAGMVEFETRCLQEHFAV